VTGSASNVTSSAIRSPVHERQPDQREHAEDAERQERTGQLVERQVAVVAVGASGIRAFRKQRAWGKPPPTPSSRSGRKVRAILASCPVADVLGLWARALRLLRFRRDRLRVCADWHDEPPDAFVRKPRRPRPFGDLPRMRQRSAAGACGWQAYLVDSDDDGTDEIVFYCRGCAAREFGRRFGFRAGVSAGVFRLCGAPVRAWWRGWRSLARSAAS